MSGPATPPQWYLARDGQQFGPISEAEMAKLVELGHLQPTDLLWREGFPDWRPAMVVFPPQARGVRPTRPGAAARERPQDQPVPEPAPIYPGPHPAHEAAAQAASQPEPSEPGRLGRLIAAVLVLLILAAAGGGAYMYRAQLASLAASFTTSSGATAIADRKSLETPPFVGFRAGTPEAIDASLQTTALWRVIKREFPDWYAQRIEEAVALARENKDDAVIGQYVARKLAELRRQQVTNGLSAKLPMLKAVAVAYFETLGKLRAHSAEACSGFVRQGETEPLIVGFLQGSEHTEHLQALVTAVFEAIADGRQVPRVHPQPSQAQYAALASELTKRGWTQEDFRILSSKQAMAQAEPAKVCQLVYDFFAAQLALPDQEAQIRLLVDSLRPVFAG